MTWSKDFYELLYTDPKQFIIASFNELHPIIQKDLCCVNGDTIDMTFLREVGVPQHSLGCFRMLKSDFIIEHNNLLTVKKIFDRHHVQQVPSLCDSICLHFLGNEDTDNNIVVTYIDVQDSGQVKVLTGDPNDMSNCNILFVNTSIRQYITTMAYVFEYWKNMPTIDEFDSDDGTIYDEYRSLYFNVINDIDSHALPRTYKDYIDTPDEDLTYWMSFYNLLDIN